MEFLMIAFAHFMALLSPGPDFFLILQTSLRLSGMYAAALCCGIAIANGIYIIIAVAGLETVRNFSSLAGSMKYFGGAYLVYIGILLLRAPRRSLEKSDNVLLIKSLPIQFGIGFLSAILNPKNGIFYFSLFTVIVSEATQFFTRLIYGVWMFFVVLLWDLLVAAFIGNSWVKERFSRVIFTVEKVAGVILTAFGVLLSFS